MITWIKIDLVYACFEIHDYIDHIVQFRLLTRHVTMCGIRSLKEFVIVCVFEEG